MTKKDNRQYDLEDVIGIYKIGDGYAVSKDGSITIGFKVTMPELDTLCGSDFFAKEDSGGLNLNPMLQVAIKELDEDYIYHQQDIFFYNQVAIPDYQGYIAKSVKRLYNESMFLDCVTYIFITKRTATFKASSYSDTELNKFTDVINRFRASILPLKPTRMTTENWVEYLECFFSCSFKKDETEPLCNISFKDMTYGDKQIKGYSINGDKAIRDISISSRNAQRSSAHTERYNSWIAPLCWEIPCYKIVNNIIYRASQQSIKGNVKDYESKIAFAEFVYADNIKSAQSYSEYLESGYYIPVYHHFNTFFVYDKADSKRINEKIDNAFVKIGLRPTVLSFSAEHTFMSSIGGCVSFLEYPFDLYPSFLDEAVCFSNLENSYMQAKQGIVFADTKGNPCIVDIIEEPAEKGLISNWNGIVVGPSGTGKSVTLNKIISSLLMNDYFFFIIDIGGSYRNLCSMLGSSARYITLDPEGKQLSFNPFLIPLVDPNNDPEKELEAEIEVLCDLLFLSWDTDQQLGYKGNPNCYSQLSDLLMKFFIKRYDQQKEYVNFTDFYDYIKETHSRQEIKTQYFDVESFTLVMKKFTKGESFGFLYNGESNLLDFKGLNMIVIELEALSERQTLYKITTAMVMILAKRVIDTSKAVHKLLLLDEAWKLLGEGYFGDFLKFQYKTIRKKGGGVFIIVQDVADLIQSPHADAIINNSDTLIFLSHETKENELKKHKERLSLNENHLSLALSIKKSDHAVFIKQGSYARTLGVKLSEEELILFSSSKRDKVTFSQYMKQCSDNIKMATDEYCQNKEINQNTYQ